MTCKKAEEFNRIKSKTSPYFGAKIMMLIPHDVELNPGSWTLSIISQHLMFHCPNGHVGVLLDHEILPDGTVRPSVDCPREGCDFHEHIKLDGWKDAQV